MLDHIGVRVSNPAASRRFYEAALQPLGYSVMVEIPKEHTNGLVVLGLGVPPKPDLWLSEDPSTKTPTHLAFLAQTREQVDAFYKAALAAGGKDNGAPGPRPQYHPGYYGAFVLDPDGHNVEVVFHAVPRISG